jgi:hypothetical protein
LSPETCVGEDDDPVVLDRTYSLEHVEMIMRDQASSLETDVTDFGKPTEQEVLQKLTMTSGMAIVPEEDARSEELAEETSEQVTVPAQDKIDALSEELLGQQQDLGPPAEQ